MEATLVIHSRLREGKGKSITKKLRHDSHIPAVVYGHNFAPLKLVLDESEIIRAFKAGRKNAEDYRLLNLVIDNKGAAQETMVVIKEIQRHPLTNAIRHIDFFAVRMDEKIVAPVHIRLTGKAPGEKSGGILRQILREIKVKSLPADIPPHIDLDVSQLDIGGSLHVSDLHIPDNMQVLDDLHAPVVSILAPTIIKEEVAAPAAEAEVAAEAKGQTPAEAPEKEKD